MTRLQNFFSQHQTTGDTKSVDYDYSGEDESSNEPTHFTLPLAPIWNESSNGSQYTIDKSEASTVQYEIELNDFSFHSNNKSDFHASDTNATYSDERLLQAAADDQDNIEQKVSEEDQKNVSTEKSKLDENSNSLRHPDAIRVNGDDTNLKENDSSTSTADSLSLSENTDFLDPIMETTSPGTLRVTMSFDDLFGDDNYSTTLGDENSQTEKTIDDTSEATTNAIQLDDYFDTILLNDSLLIDESSSSSYENTTNDVDNDSTTVFTLMPFESGQPNETVKNTITDETITSTQSHHHHQLLSPTTIKNSFTVLSTPNNDFSDENRIIKDDQQIAELENVETSNKFVYHHFTTTEKSSTTATPSSIVRFPSEVETKSKVRFPDSHPVTMSFSWPRDHGYQTVGVMRFWRDQPLIEDFKFFTRGDSRGSNLGINRPQTTHRRNY